MTEQLLYFHLTNASSTAVREVARQAALTGWEAVLLSYGSGFDPSSDDDKYIEQASL